MGKARTARRYPSRLEKIKVRAARRCPVRLQKKMKKQALRTRGKEEKRKEKEAKWKEKEENRKAQEQKKKRFLKFEKYYWKRVRESDGFDISNLKRPPNGLIVFKCKGNCCPLLLRLYAKLGLHCYNLLQGTNLQLHGVEKYNRGGMYLAASYYITLLAEDPATSSLVPFQTKIQEQSRNRMSIKCYVARLKNTESKGLDDNAPHFLHVKEPEWPSDVALADKERFYVVPESEWEKNDWIRLYLELALLTTTRLLPNPKLSDFKIMEVVIETEENVKPLNERLKGFRDAVVYIKYDQDLGEGQVRKRRARIRRNVDLRSGRLSLVGADSLEGTDSEQ